MKNLILLDNYYAPAELEGRISEWVNHYNNHRYHEAIDNVTPSDRFFGRDKDPGTTAKDKSRDIASKEENISPIHNK